VVARITLADAQAWAENTKLPFNVLDDNLLKQVETHVLSKLQSCGIDITLIGTWIDSATTPELVKSIISMMYVSWYYDRQYSEDQSEGNDYAAMLRDHAKMLLQGVCDGTIEIPGAPTIAGKPAFFPTDESSASQPTSLEPELGGPYFNMSRGF
jgi:hypothetical protein